VASVGPLRIGGGERAARLPAQGCRIVWHAELGGCVSTRIADLPARKADKDGAAAIDSPALVPLSYLRSHPKPLGPPASLCRDSTGRLAWRPGLHPSFGAAARELRSSHYLSTWSGT